MEFLILGNGSASPHIERNPSAALLSLNNIHILIDCGEGTQYRLLQRKIKVNRIKYIFISHLHGDHYYGLIALVSTMSMQKRTEPLTIFGPNGLKEILSLQLQYSDSKLNYPIQFTEIKEGQSNILIDEIDLNIISFPLQHRIACNGFKFTEIQNKRKLLAEKLPDSFPNVLKALLVEGKDVTDPISNDIYKFQDYTLEPEPPKTLAYCSDTIFDPSITENFQEVDTLYHEATFTDELENRAKITYHSTATEAAKIAKLAHAKHLIIGHFSARYKTLEDFETEAQAIFPNTSLAIEGENFII